MYGIFIGRVIKQRREELGLSQEQLCEGICTPATLSRIENGRQAPAYNRVNALLQRLGLPEDRYYAMMTHHEMEINQLQTRIMSAVYRYDLASGAEKETYKEQGLQMLQDLKEQITEEDAIIGQFILSVKAVLGKKDGPYSWEEQQALFLDAIRLTVPDFDEEDILCHIYSYDEIKLITQLAVSYGAGGRHEKAIDLFGQLLKYIRKNGNISTHAAKRVPMIAYNYALQLGLAGRYADAIDIAERGCQASLEICHYKFLPGLAHIRAECYYRLGKMEKSEDLYRQAYYTYKLIGDEVNRPILEAEANKYLGMTFS